MHSGRVHGPRDVYSLDLLQPRTVMLPEQVFTIAVIEGFPVPELVLLGDASLYDSEARGKGSRGAGSWSSQRAERLIAQP